MGPISPNRVGAHSPERANRPITAFSRTGLFLDTFKSTRAKTVLKIVGENAATQVKVLP